MPDQFSPYPKTRIIDCTELSRHLRRLQDIHSMAAERIRKVAQQREAPQARGVRLNPGDLVLVRQNLPGRTKIQDLWGEIVHVVVSTPPAEGGPFVIRPRDEEGPIRRVTGSQLRLYHEPTDRIISSCIPDENINDTNSFKEIDRPVPLPRKSLRFHKTPVRLDL
ncbi:hypothetical protein EGW08_020772 [Elysia chlorotica]|uniref:Uncharacterized protein n=1 Tax=Elysia chlorotica TaxID=188477 RepID=A0A3S0Z626_ELYCH|nr:hypothetical protein EGW08_020772 [Elysia chlorotica]